MLASLFFLSIQTSLIAQATDSSAQAIQDIGCETTAKTLALSTTQALRLRCPADCDPSIEIWGTTYYTEDSSICVAALHAGAPLSEDGALSVYQSNEREAFIGSTKNNIISQNSGAWPSAFRFDGNADAQDPKLLTCENSLRSLAPEFRETGAVFSVLCPENCSSATVWGTEVYTNDSSICRAAIHAGALPLEGGQTKVFAAPGQPAYTGTEQNGVVSRDWRSWPGSFLFTSAINPVNAVQLSCEDSVQRFSIEEGATLLVHCPPDCQEDRSDNSREIWGFEVYSNDSAVCRAAIHSGALSPRGGTVTLEMGGVVSSLASVEQNDIMSRGWGGPWFPTFRFVNP